MLLRKLFNKGRVTNSKNKSVRKSLEVIDLKIFGKSTERAEGKQGPTLSKYECVNAYGFNRRKVKQSSK